MSAARVAEVFRTAGVRRPLRVLPATGAAEASGTCFVLEPDDYDAVGDVVAIEDAVSALLGGRVWVLRSVGDGTVPFASGE